MVFFEQLSTSLKQKWLQYYQKNRPWLILHMTDQNTVPTPDGGRRPISYLILGIINALEPELEALMLPFSKLKADADSLIEVLGLNFDPDIALGNKSGSSSSNTTDSPSKPISAFSSPDTRDDIKPPESDQPVMPEEDRDSSNWGNVAAGALGGAAGVVGATALASALGQDSDDFLPDDQSDLDLEPELADDDLDLGMDLEPEAVDDLDLEMESESEADEDLDLGMESEPEAVDELDLGMDLEPEAVDDLDLGMDLEPEAVDDLDLGMDLEPEAVDDLDLEMESGSEADEDLDLGLELDATDSEDDLGGFTDIGEDSDTDLSDIDLGDMEEETSDYDLGKSSSDFIAEDIPDPFEETSNDFDESGLDDLGGDDVLGDTSSDDISDIELSELGDDNPFDDLSSDDLGDLDLDLEGGDLDFDDADLDSLAGDKKSSDDDLEGLLG
ncbi:MAG: DUF5331 domain-containing protein [Microcoleaceae cyanobacterium]